MAKGERPAGKRYKTRWAKEDPYGLKALKEFGPTKRCGSKYHVGARDAARTVQNFARCAVNRDGLQGKCQGCCAAWAADNPERRRESHLRIGAARRARAAGVPYSAPAIDELFPVAPLCPVFGIQYTHGKGKSEPSSATLDRIRPALGYVAGNLEIISNKANAAKSTLTPKELLQLAVHCYLSRGERARLIPRLRKLIAEWDERAESLAEARATQLGELVSDED